MHLSRKLLSGFERYHLFSTIESQSASVQPHSC